MEGVKNYFVSVLIIMFILIYLCTIYKRENSECSEFNNVTISELPLRCYEHYNLKSQPVQN